MRSCCVTRSAIAMAGVRIALAHGPSPGCDFQYTINRNRVSFEVCAARLGEAGHEKVLACQLLSISGMDSCQHRTIAIPTWCHDTHLRNEDGKLIGSAHTKNNELSFREAA